MISEDPRGRVHKYQDLLSSQTIWRPIQQRRSMWSFSLFSKGTCNQCFAPYGIFPWATRMPRQDGSPGPPRWRVRQIHDDAGRICVAFDNPWMDLNDVGKYFIVPTTAITNTDHKSKEEKITWKEGPARHLMYYVNRPLPAVWAGHQSSISFRGNEKYRHGEERI